eukprot:gb/GECG01010672.1/.p1 GENE.gb/GECG01010672.1/~~gb/GECG01010672.1/.p1  ORF type:complete len:463 (+),score=91.86 gb/GECG01010672.1/:1-1389(+)
MRAVGGIARNIARGVPRASRTSAFLKGTSAGGALSLRGQQMIKPTQFGTPVGNAGSVRFLNLHEYQSKDLLESYAVSVQKGKVARSADEAYEVAKWLKKENPEAELIVKAQIHAGGRGKGHFIPSGYKGGVQICDTPEEVKERTSNMLGQYLVTKQTTSEGQLCKNVLVNEGISIDRECYFAILMDRNSGGPAIVASTEGGVDIEEVAEKNPSAIVTLPVDINKGLIQDDALKLADKLKFTGEKREKAAYQFQRLYEFFIGTDATQVEINPLVEGSVPGGESGLVFAVDAKLNFDDNASFRQSHIFDMRDKDMEDPRDVRAEEAGLNYIGLDGNIGCMVNGAGLAMATMDIIKLNGGNPANFLDVGGSATTEQVTEAFKILTSDENVEAILVNIFGGIMKCDTIANGIVIAAKEVGLNIPLIVRLEGTNVAEGKKILADSDVNVVTADDLDSAAARAISQLQ